MPVILVDTFIAGRPKTKGSLTKRSRTGPLVESVVDSGHWRALMAGGVRDGHLRRCGPNAGPYPSAVAVAAVFDLPVDPLTIRAGDLDKLARNLLDALASDARNPKYNGGVILNDNQVVELALTKRGPSTTPGVHVVVRTLD